MKSLGNNPKKNEAQVSSEDKNDFLFWRAMKDFDDANTLAFELAYKEASQMLFLSVTLITVTAAVATYVKIENCLQAVFCVLFTLSNVTTIITSIIVIKYKTWLVCQYRNNAYKQLQKGPNSDAVKTIETPKFIKNCKCISISSFVVSLISIPIIALILMFANN